MKSIIVKFKNKLSKNEAVSFFKDRFDYEVQDFIENLALVQVAIPPDEYKETVKTLEALDEIQFVTTVKYYKPA